MERTRAILIDITKCIGCRSCEQACKEIHGFPKPTEARLSPTALTIIEDHGDRFVRRMCMHCQDPACASACLVGALKKTALGPVTYDSSKCIGCRYCLVACPFNVPRYEWTKLVAFVKKCDMCAARQAKGEVPACVEACPVQTSIVGWRDEILEEAEWRILGDSKYVKYIYGSEEAGGTSVFFISDVPFGRWREETLSFWVEIALFVIVPLVLLSGEKVQNSPQFLYWTCSLIVMGFMTNRLNVSITGPQASAGVYYVPKWTEFASTLMVLTAVVLAFRYAVIYLDLAQEHAAEVDGEGECGVGGRLWPLGVCWSGFADN